MKYRHSLLTYAQKYGVSRASQVQQKPVLHLLLACPLRRFPAIPGLPVLASSQPPNQHTQEELKLIADMHRRNPNVGIVELWARMRIRGYTRTVESLWRVMRREGWTAQVEKKKPYKPKPCEQMQYPGQRVQIDVKVVPRRCIADAQLKLYQYTAIDEYSRYRVLSDTCSLTWSEIDWDRKARVIRRMVQREARAGCLENGGSKQGSSYKKLQKSPGSASC